MADADIFGQYAGVGRDGRPGATRGKDGVDDGFDLARSRPAPILASPAIPLREAVAPARRAASRSSFSFALRLLLAAAVTLPLLIVAAGAWPSWQQVWAEAEADTARTAETAAEFARRLLDGHQLRANQVEMLLRGLSDAEIRAREAEFHAELRRIAATAGDGQGDISIWVFDSTGAALVSSVLLPVPRGQSGADREYHQALRVPGAPLWHVSAVIAGRTGDRTFFPVSRRRAGPEGVEDGGTINVSVSTAHAGAALARLIRDEDDVVSLTRRDGALLARSAGFGPLGTAARALPGGPLMAVLARGDERGSSLGRSALDGVVRLAAFRRVEGWPVWAAVARPRAAILQEWRAAVLPQLAVAVPASLALLALALLVRRGQQRLALAKNALEQRVSERTHELAASEATARAALEELDSVYANAPVGLCVLDAEGRFRRVNRRMAEIDGVPAEAHLGRSIGEVLPDLAEVSEALHRQVMASGRAVLDVEVTGETPAEPGVRRTWLQGWLPLRDPAGQVYGVSVVAEEVTERRRAQAALAESEARFREMADNAPVMVWVSDAGGAITFMSRSWYQFTGRPPDSGLGEGWAEAVHAEDRPAVRDALQQATERREPFRLEHRLHRADGETRWAICAATPRQGPDGSFLGHVGSLLDITARREAEERRLLLAREVDHRAKNALAVVQAAVRLTRADDIASFVRAVEGRVTALARAHTMLAEGEWRGIGLRALVEGEFGAFTAGADGTPRIDLEGPDLTLAPPATQALSMVVHELATNAVKYGALSVAGGRVAVSWELDRAVGLLRLHWREQGGPPVERPPERRSFGSRVIETTLRDQLGGAVERRWERDGLACDIALPLARILVR